MGSLIVHTGTMFGGKSEALFAVDASRSFVQAFRPQKDTRDQTDNLTSHNGKRMACTRILRAEEIEPLLWHSTTTILVDEVHMLDAETPEEFRRLVDVLNYTVVVAGLSTDFRGKPFPIVSDLLALADEITFHAATCECGDRAVYNQRLTSDARVIVPGGASEYAPRCRQCFVTHESS